MTFKSTHKIPNPWPYSFSDGNGNLIEVEEIVLRAPTVNDRQVYESTPGDDRKKTHAMLKRMVTNVPPSALDHPGFTHHLYVLLVDAIAEHLADQKALDAIFDDVADGERIDMPKRQEHVLQVPLEIDGREVGSVWINPPPFTAYDEQTSKDFVFWAGPFFSKFLSATIGGETKPINGDAILDMSFQDAQCILFKLDLFSPPGLAAWGASAQYLKTQISSES